MSTTLYYIHDPMCSWCWGYKPTWSALQLHLPEFIKVEYVAGGLAPDSNTPMASEQQAMIEAHWHTIKRKLGTEFNFDFWRNNIPRRSTYNSCRAAIAANFQGCQEAMIEAIQHAYYLRALNPSDSDILISVASELSNKKKAKENIASQPEFDIDKFIADYRSEETQKELNRQVQFSRELSHQGFPSLVLECDGERHSIIVDYKDYQASLNIIKQLLGK